MIAKITLNLIPQSSFYKNCRSLLSSNNGNRIRKLVYQQANYQCEICQATEQTYNQKGGLHCNEIGDFFPQNKYRGIQKLVKLEAICGLCHYAKHQGYAAIIGKYDIGREHMKKVNGGTWKDLERHEREQGKLGKQRSILQGEIDLEGLKKEYKNYYESKSAN